MASLINTLGGPYGFGYDSLWRSDGDSIWIDISSVFPNGLNFYGTRWDTLIINTNGNISFGDPVYDYTPDTSIAHYYTPMIAPFWADVDTSAYLYLGWDGETFVDITPGGNSAGTNLIWYDLDPWAGTVTVTWDDVGYSSGNVDWLNAFQLQLQDTGNGDFDITFIYEDINWVTGDFSGGVAGIGGTPARAGFTAGDGVNYFEFAASGDTWSMLDLDNTYFTGENAPGIWSFSVRNGSVTGGGHEDRNDTLIGTSGDDLMDGRGGDDWLEGGSGNDNMAGGAGDDHLFGQDGDDLLIGGSGINYLSGGYGTDTALYSGSRNTLDITVNGYGEYIVRGEDFEDTLNSIEYIEFDDGLMSPYYAVQVRDSQEEFARFYNALFKRNPDAEGLAYWVNDLAAGNSMPNAAQAFTESSEFERLYGPNVRDREFVDLLYQNILGREADQAGYNYWLQEIAYTGNRGGMIVSFANSQEYIDQTQAAIDQYLSDIPLDGYILF